MKSLSLNRLDIISDKFTAVLAMSSSSPSSEGNSPDSPLDLCVRIDDSSPVLHPAAFPLLPSSPKAETTLHHPTTPFTSLMNSLVAAAAANASSTSGTKFKSKIWSPGASCESERENGNGGGNNEGDTMLGGADRVITKEQPEGKKVKRSNGSKEERTFKVGRADAN